LWIHYTDFGRSGNRLQQLQDVNFILSRCSGVAISKRKIEKDAAVAFPPLILAAREEPEDMGTIIEMAARTCKEVTYQWNSTSVFTEHCPPKPEFKIRQWAKEGPPPESVSLLSNVYSERPAWQFDMTPDTMAMYFRGGDILAKASNVPDYSQGPCSLFVEAWKVTNASRILLIYDGKDKKGTINPCVDVVRETVPASQIMEAPCSSVGCHLILIGRATYVVVSGHSTFPAAAMALFPARRRVTFQYFCGAPPKVTGNAMEICIDGETKGLIPWHFTKETRQIMLERPSKVNLGKREDGANVVVVPWRDYLRS
jgi:hypothetical protein